MSANKKNGYRKTATGFKVCGDEDCDDCLAVDPRPGATGGPNDEFIVTDDFGGRVVVKRSELIVAGRIAADET